MKEKREKTENKDGKEQERRRGTEAVMKGWELNDFAVHFRFSPINM